MDGGSLSNEAPIQTQTPTIDADFAAAMEINQRGLERAGAKAESAPVEAAKPTDAKPATELKPGETPRGEKGLFEKKPETIEKEKSAAHEKAMHALRRAHIPDGALDGMKPEQILAWGSALAAKQAEQDGKSSELGKKAKESRAAEPVRTGQPQNAADNLPVIETKALAEKYALGEDELKGIEGLVHESVRPYVEQLAERDSAIAEIETERHELAFELAIAHLSATYPEVAEHRDQIKAKYEANAESGAYDEYELKEGARLCARDAIEFVCKPAIDQRKKAASEAESRAKGSLATGTRQGDGSLPGADAELAAAHYLNQNPGQWREASTRFFGR